MKAEELALVQGWADTRRTLARWNRRPFSVLWPWVRGSLAVTGLLLGTIWLVATLATPDPTGAGVPGVSVPARTSDFAFVLYRNGLVLALHALACVAGFMAGSSLPLAAEQRSGLSRWVHQKAGPLAIGFVLCATLFSLTTQAYIIGGTASSIAGQLGVAPGTLLLALAPHALPELIALFLPLAAWIVASRRGDWQDLLAATFVTVAIAIPVLLAAAAVEIWVSPHLLAAIAT